VLPSVVLEDFGNLSRAYLKTGQTVMRPSATNDPHERGPIKTWVLTHLFRTWTALVTLIAFGMSFLYKPEWLTWWLRTTTAGIEKSSALLPYPWGDRVEVALRGIGGSFWIQITLAIIIVRIIAWLIGYSWRRSRRPKFQNGLPD
jgi:hypothetical protein